jgi:hypothetical protein
VELNKSSSQGLYGEGFVYALAAAASLTAEKANFDVTGIDFTFTYPGARGTRRYPAIQAQVKSWSIPAGNARNWRYPIRVRHFNRLAGEFLLPRYLFLVIVPADAVDYAHADSDRLLLHHACYWASLRPHRLLPQGPGDPQQVTVDVPRDHLLTVDSLLKLMDSESGEAVAS